MLENIYGSHQESNLCCGDFFDQTPNFQDCMIFNVFLSIFSLDCCKKYVLIRQIIIERWKRQKNNETSTAIY